MRRKQSENSREASVFPGQTFSPHCFQLGENLSQESSCRPKEAVSEAEMVISAGLRECETESSVKISSAGTLKGLKEQVWIQRNR